MAKMDSGRGRLDKPAMTVDQARDNLVSHIWSLIHYWRMVDPGRSTDYKMEGLAFSILTMLDGESLNLPAMSVTPIADPDSEWPSEDIGGSLHERFHDIGREMGLLRGES
jgi:hypothetical protein